MLSFDKYYNSLVLESSWEDETRKMLNNIINSSSIEEIEKMISVDGWVSLLYARDVLHTEFPLGEPAIAKNKNFYASDLYHYALSLKEGKPFKEAEPKIATDGYVSFNYANNILNGPFKLGEPSIAKHSLISCEYANKVLKGPFKLGEPVIALDYKLSVVYARDVLKGPFKLGEPAIAKDGEYSFIYALQVLKDRFELGEKAMVNACYAYWHLKPKLKSYIELLESKNIPIPEKLKNIYE